VVEDETDESERRSPLTYPVVGIGASAGGVEAYIEPIRRERSNPELAAYSIYFNFTGYHQILPFLEQGNAFNATNFDAYGAGGFWGWDDPANSIRCSRTTPVSLRPQSRQGPSAANFG